MRGRSLTIVGIFAGIVAAVLILFCGQFDLAAITMGCGIMFVAVGVLNLAFFSFRSKAESGRLLNLVSNGAACILGICMLVFEREFAPMVTFMLGLFMAVCALWQFFVLAIGARPFQLAAWFYLFPVAITGCSIYLFMCRNNSTSDSTLLLTTGVGLALLCLGCVLEGSALGLVRRRHEKALASSAGDSTAEDHSVADAAYESSVLADEAAQKPVSQPKPKVETTEDLDDVIRTDSSDDEAK